MQHAAAAAPGQQERGPAQPRGAARPRVPQTSQASAQGSFKDESVSFVHVEKSIYNADPS